MTWACSTILRYLVIPSLGGPAGNSRCPWHKPHLSLFQLVSRVLLDGEICELIGEVVVFVYGIMELSNSAYEFAGS